MDVILLERIEKLGQMGDVVKVRPGFARNYLLPQKKALRATEENKKYFDGQRAQLEAANLEQRKDAEAVAGRLEGLKFVIVRQASDNDQLYGSVTVRNIAQAVTEAGFTIDSKQVQMTRPIKTVGLHDVSIRLHPEVTVTVSANVARSAEEAKAQAEGRVLGRDDDAEDAADEFADVFEKEEDAAAAAQHLVEEDASAGNDEPDGEEPKLSCSPWCRTGIRLSWTSRRDARLMGACARLCTVWLVAQQADRYGT